MYLYICIYIYLYTCIFINLCIYIYVYIYIYIYIYGSLSFGPHPRKDDSIEHLQDLKKARCGCDRGAVQEDNTTGANPPTAGNTARSLDRKNYPDNRLPTPVVPTNLGGDMRVTGLQRASSVLVQESGLGVCSSGWNVGGVGFDVLGSGFVVQELGLRM